MGGGDIVRGKNAPFAPPPLPPLNAPQNDVTFHANTKPGQSDQTHPHNGARLHRMCGQRRLGEGMVSIDLYTRGTLFQGALGKQHILMCNPFH